MSLTPSKARPGTTVVSNFFVSPYVYKVTFSPGIDAAFSTSGGGGGGLSAAVPYGAISGPVNTYYPGGVYVETIYVIADLPSPKIINIAGLSLSFEKEFYYEIVAGVQLLMINNAGGVTPGSEIDVASMLSADLTGYGTTAPNTSQTYRIRYYDGSNTYNGPTTYVAFAPTMAIVGNSATAPSTRPSGILELRLQKRVSGVWSDHATSVANSQAVDLTSLPAGTPVRWRYLFSSGGQGGSDTFSVSDSVTWVGAPPTPVVDSKTDVEITLSAITFGDEYDEVKVQIKEVSAAYDAGTAVTTGVDIVLSGLTAATSYLIRYAATIDSDTIYSAALPVTTFDEGGEGGGESEDAPAAPLDLEDTDLTNSSVVLIMGALAMDADYQGIELKQTSQADSFYAASAVHLTDAGEIPFTGLTSNTRYSARPFSFNTYGVTYGHVYRFKTERFAAIAAPPAAPPAPTLAAKTTSSATIAQPAWPDTSSSLLLYRGDPEEGGVLVHTYATEGEGHYTDTGVSNGHAYDYYAVAHNLAGDSPPSPALHVSLIAEDIDLTWIQPEEDADVANVIGLVVRKQSPSDPAATLRILLFGTPLPGLAKVSGSGTDGQYKAYLDTTELDYQGEVTFYAIGTDADGYDTEPVPLTVNIDNTLFNGLRWFAPALEAPKSARIADRGERIIRAQVQARRNWLEPNFAHPGQDRYWHVFVASPAPPALAIDATAVEVAEYSRSFQRCILSHPDAPRNIELTGDPADLASKPDETLRALFIGYKVEVLLKYATPCSSLPKLREWDEGLFGFGLDPATVFQLDKSGVAVVLDLSTRGMGAAIDAARLGDDKIFSLTAAPPRVRIHDLDDADKDGDFVPVTEAKTPYALEGVGDVVLIVYVTGASSTVWAHDGRDFQIAFNLAEAVTVTQAFDDKMYFATDTFKLYSFAPGDEAPELLYTHSEDIAALQVTAAGAVQFVDGAGDIFSLANSPPFLQGSIDGAAALAEFQGAAFVRRGAAAAGNVLYLQDLEGYSPQYTLGDVTAILALRDLESILVPAAGDPLNGGAAAVTDESLWGGTAVIEDTAYYFRLQRAAPTLQSVHRGLRPRDNSIMVKPTGFAKKES